MGGDLTAVLGWILDHATVGLVAIMVWMVKSMLKVTQTLYGEQGNNGLNGDVKRLRQARHEHGAAIQRHEFQLGDHGRRIEKLEDPA